VLLAAADESQWSETETHELLNPEAQVLPDTSKLKEKQTNSETKGTSDE